MGSETIVQQECRRVRRRVKGYRFRMRRDPRFDSLGMGSDFIAARLKIEDLPTFLLAGKIVDGIERM